MAEELFVIRRYKTERSRTTQELVWDITLQDIDTGELMTTYVDESYKNYKHWQEIIENINKGLVIHIPKIRYRKGQISRRIINADCRPEIQERYNREELLASIDRHLAEQATPSNQPAGLFSKFFE